MCRQVVIVKFRQKNSGSSDKSEVWNKTTTDTLGEAGSVVVLPFLCTNEFRVRYPVPGLYVLASAGFSPGAPVFLLH